MASRSRAGRHDGRVTLGDDVVVLQHVNRPRAPQFWFVPAVMRRVGEGGRMSSTSDAFDIFRSQFAAKPCDMALVRNDDELILVTPENGRMRWQDGPGVSSEQSAPPSIDQNDPMLKLWVVDSDDVPYVLERNAFGANLETGRLKHSNLTGGADAHCGGELVIVAKNVVAINGSSGRYGPNSRRELDAVVAAFRASGYGVWNFGYDEGSNRPLNFLTGTPVWVE